MLKLTSPPFPTSSLLLDSKIAYGQPAEFGQTTTYYPPFSGGNPGDPSPPPIDEPPDQNLPRPIGQADNFYTNGELSATGYIDNAIRNFGVPTVSDYTASSTTNGIGGTVALGFTPKPATDINGNQFGNGVALVKETGGDGVTIDSFVILNLKNPSEINDINRFVADAANNVVNQVSTLETSGDTYLSEVLTVLAQTIQNDFGGGGNVIIQSAKQSLGTRSGTVDIELSHKSVNSAVAHLTSTHQENHQIYVSSGLS